MTQSYIFQAVAIILFFLNALSLAAQDLKPVTIRLLNGKTGKPMSNERLLVFFGSSPEGVRFHDGGSLDLHTDAGGEATLPPQKSGSPYLQVFVDSRTLCQNNPNGRSFSITDVRQNGTQSPNICGRINLSNSPGRLIIFARDATFGEKMAW